MLAKKDRYNVAVVGATGAVGREMVEVLEERKFPVGELQLFASERSAGEMIAFQDEDHPIQILTKRGVLTVSILPVLGGGGDQPGVRAYRGPRRRL